LQSGIGFGKLESYTKLDKLGEASYDLVIVIVSMIVLNKNIIIINCC